MDSNKNKIILGILVLLIVLLILFLFKKDAKYVTLSNNLLDTNQIEFIRIEGNRYKCKSAPQKLALEALQNLPSKSSIMLKIERPNDLVFSNNNDTIVKFLNTQIGSGDELPFIEYELLSTWELDELKLAPIYIEVYFKPNVQSTNYNYETKFSSNAIE